MKGGTRNTETTGYQKGYWAGFLSAVILLAVVRVGLWVASHNAVQVLAESVTQPIITIMDVIGVVLVLVLVWVAFVELPVRFRG